MDYPSPHILRLYTCEGYVEMDNSWQLCRTIGPLLSQRFPLASAKAQPRGGFFQSLFGEATLILANPAHDLYSCFMSFYFTSFFIWSLIFTILGCSHCMLSLYHLILPVVCGISSVETARSSSSEQHSVTFPSVLELYTKSSTSVHVRSICPPG